MKSFFFWKKLGILGVSLLAILGILFLFRIITKPRVGNESLTPWICEVDRSIVVPNPTWASETGVDAYGRWADLKIDGPIGPVMQRFRLIMPGTFLMGGPHFDESLGWRGTDEPQHLIRLTQPYWLADSECTVRFWLEIQERLFWRFHGDWNLPVHHITWQEIITFLTRLNHRVPGLNACLPTEAEWEYACRAGNRNPISGTSMAVMGWYKDNAGGTAHPVKMLAPNPWGLYDMHGNLPEICNDWWDEIPQSATDPMGPREGFAPVKDSVGGYGFMNRVIRGGSYLASAISCGSALKTADSLDSPYSSVGFRIMIPVAPLPDAPYRFPGPRTPEESEVDTAPPWASTHGKDEIGFWAELRSATAAQRFRLIRPGAFVMGDLEQGLMMKGDQRKFKPPRNIRLTRWYWIATTECTQEFWRQVTGKNPSCYFSENNGSRPKIPDDEQRPVEKVSKKQVLDFLTTLNQRNPGLETRLPTDAEWEYACRAGSAGLYSGSKFHSWLEDYLPQNEAEEWLQKLAWYKDNQVSSDVPVHPVARKQANAWGLYDMHGNVWELCSDIAHFPWDRTSDAFGESPFDPAGSPVDYISHRRISVLRGGAYHSPAFECRSAARWICDDTSAGGDIGFRIAISASLKNP